MASLGDALLAVAGGAAQAYNEDVARRRQKELDMMARTQELAKMAQFRLIETQFNADLQRQQSEYEMENTIESMGGRNSPDAKMWYLTKKLGWTPEEARRAIVGGHKIPAIPVTKHGNINPLEYGMSLIDQLAQGNKGNTKLPRRLMSVSDRRYTFNPSTFELDETAIAIGNKEGPFSGDDFKRANELFREEQAKLEQERLIKEFEERTKKAPKLLTNVSEKGIAAGLVDEETAEVSNESFTPFGAAGVTTADLKLTEAKDTYKDKDGKTLRLAWSPVTSKYYKSTEAGPVVVNPDDFTLEGTDMSQRDRDFAEMTVLRERIAAGEELSDRDKSRYTFLLSNHTDTILGPVTKLDDGTEIQDTYAYNKFDGTISKVTEFYKQGSQPVLPTLEQSRMAATEIEFIADDIATEQVQKGAFEEEFSKQYPDMDDSVKNVIHTNAYVLAQYYLRHPSKKFSTKGVAYEKAFETIAQFYNPEGKRLFVTQLHAHIQDLIGGDAVDAAWVSESQKIIRDNPDSVEARSRKAAMKAGNYNAESYRRFINDQRRRK